PQAVPSPLLGGIGGPWGNLQGTPSSGLGTAWGGADFQIESRSDVDWGPWSERVRSIVKSNWYSIMPVAAKVGMKGIVQVHFRVHRDGTITDYDVVSSAGLPPLDDAVRTALTSLSNPLPTLPIPASSD